ncbi:unnamed protein product, partial [Durusdinium trenchii]
AFAWLSLLLVEFILLDFALAPDFDMTTVERKEQIATWNGDASSWLEYVKRVRLQYERTEPRKRKLLGSSKRRSDVTTPHAGANDDFATFPEFEEHTNPGHQEPLEDPESFDPNAPYHELPQDDEQNRTWSSEEWRQWRRDQWKKWKSDDQASTWPDDDEEEVPIKWEQFDYGDVQILPSEILGWLLLRRSGLPAAARLSVLSAISNQLDLDTVERAMRDQEEELLLAEQHRSRDHGSRRQRSFWVEQDHQWGLVNPSEDLDDVDESMIMWVGDRLPPELQPSWDETPSETAWTTWTPDGQELSWQWHDDDFYAQDSSGAFWSWTETKDWLDLEECLAVTPADSEELLHAYATFNDRIRTFRESRQLNHAKQQSRGYYPMGLLKGKGKGKGSKSKGKQKRVPVLLSVRTLRKLGAVIDMATNTMHLKNGYLPKDAEEKPMVAPSTPSTTTSTSTSVTKEKAKAKSSKAKTRVPSSEKYDYERMTGPDPRDPRTQGFPCWGNHQKMPEGRGSLSGRNGHGRWSVCQKCRLRLEYIPTFGAKGTFRQAGPLPKDVETVVQQVGTAVEDHPPAREMLNTKAVGLIGAEESMRRRLQQLENEKSALKPKPRPGESPRTSPQTYQSLSEESKKAVKRENEKAAESQESSEGWSQEYKDFEPVTNILTDEQKSRLQYQATEFLAEAYSAMEQFPEENFEISLMELCCPPDSRLTQTFLDHGKQAIRIGLPAIDFSHKKGLHEVLQMIDRWKPKVLWISLPCGPYSPIQELFNESTPESLAKSLERKKRAKKLIHHGIEAAEHQITRGGEVAWEWPVNNRGWTLPRVRAFFEKLAASGSDFGARVDGCAHGLKGPKGLPVKKPWRIRTTSSTLAGALHRLCPGHEQHEECLGGKTARDSGFYPQSMCNVIYKSVVEMMACGKNFNVFPSAYPIFDTKDLEDLEEKKKSVRLLSEDEKKQAGKLVDRLRKKTGHPSNAALAGVLRHRGAHPEIIQMASQHHCSECQELRAAPLHAAATLEKSDTLWEVLVVDNMQFTADGATHHYMVMMDEASRLVCAHHLFSHDPEESRNATAQEVMDGLGTWFLHYGMPAKVRMDAEGAFRSTLLGQWCSERGLELLFCAAEDHGQIGLVERAISTLKSTIRQILQGGDHSVKEAVIAACCTHNSMERIGGYSPCQWAFGRQPTLTGRMHDRGHDDPWWTSSAVPGSSVMQNLRLRVKAQQSFLQAQAHELISRASNSKTRKEQIFLPGDLVYFKRIKPPAQSQALMRMPFKLWRWYGPARVLASETRTDSFGTQRKPSNIVWIVSQGRLKRCSPSQLRHASAREKVIAEGMSAPTAVWTFHSLARDILKGEYGILDDQMFPEDVTAKGPQRATRRSQSLGRAPMTPVPATPTTTRRSSSVPRTPVLRTPEDVRGTREDVPNKTSNKIRSEMSGGEEAHRGASSSEAPKEREKKVPKLESVARDVDRSDLQSPRVDISRLLRDPGYEPDAMASRGAGRPLSELFEQPLFEKQRKHLAADTDDVLLATSFFTSNGSVQIGNLACCIELPVPHTSSELRRMKRSPENFFIKKVKGAEVKWHLLDEQEKAKFKIAKEAEVSQWLQAAAVKAAIGPVPRNRLIRMRWVLTYKDTGVRDTLLRLGFVQSKTDPCLWLFFQEEEDGSRNTLGFVCSHVDDFLVAGDEQSSAWTDAVTSFYQSFRWSPWECNAYTHCGIQLKEEHDFSTTLDHSKFIESIEQIQFRARPDHEAVTPDELTQLRGILGALQWRTHQTTPLQAARLGQLQSEISHATVGTLKAANKLAREAFHQRHVSTRINQLGLNDPKEVCFIGWSDAALANRRDLGSTGGYIIAVTSPSMLDGKRSPLTFVSWRSARLQRKARSSLAAEAQALAECDQELMFCRLAWAELCGFCVNLKVSHEAVSQVPGCVVIDAKALYDVLMKKDLNSSGLGLRDKFSALEILCLLESIDLNKTTVRWVHSEAQLADALTKPLPAGALFKAIVE